MYKMKDYFIGSMVSGNFLSVLYVVTCKKNVEV